MADDSSTLSGDAPTLELDVSSAKTVAIARVTSEPAAVELGDDQLAALGFSERYVFERNLGEGGMGVVKLLHDRQIGRRVAVKLMRGQGGRDEQARFVREARVQGQLEHPAVVPVYDLGVDPDGRCFFSMKRVNGATLEEVLAELRAGSEEARRTWSERRLLSAFSSICLAVEFAHRRGVVHRDLKPGNVMLGGFGEVYVLDWGLSKVAGLPELPPAASVALPHDAGSETLDGAVLGTPGYMSPEQARGERDVDARADVFALGAVVFECLAGDPPGRRSRGVARPKEPGARWRRGRDNQASSLPPVCRHRLAGHSA